MARIKGARNKNKLFLTPDNPDLPRGKKLQDIKQNAMSSRVRRLNKATVKHKERLKVKLTPSVAAAMKTKDKKKETLSSLASLKPVGQANKDTENSDYKKLALSKINNNKLPSKRANISLSAIEDKKRAEISALPKQEQLKWARENWKSHRRIAAQTADKHGDTGLLKQIFQLYPGEHIDHIYKKLGIDTKK